MLWWSIQTNLPGLSSKPKQAISALDYMSSLFCAYDAHFARLEYNYIARASIQAIAEVPEI